LRIKCIINPILIYFVGPSSKFIKKALRIFFIDLHNNIIELVSSSQASMIDIYIAHNYVNKMFLLQTAIIYLL